MHAFKKAMGEQQIPLDLAAITYRTIRNHLVLYAIEQWNNKPRTILHIRTDVIPIAFKLDPVSFILSPNLPALWEARSKRSKPIREAICLL
ncbi:hypothetical protein [Desulforamulus ruminis]|nr:hypothetical protein [Desulforamulus ruminis]